MTTFAQAIPLRRFNNGLTVGIILLAMYVIFLPFIPGWSWWAEHEAPIISTPPTVQVPAATAAPTENSLYIPALALHETIFDGSSATTLRKGVWHIPKTSSPDQGSNTVLAAHRHTKSGPGVFYNLDKLKTGNQLFVFWDKQRYQYVVTSIRVVPPTEVSVQAPSKTNILTLYTCTPLWSFKDRLVVRAELKETP
jgi:LPXTG-site transpeptidase (sortase) family protein